MRRKDRAELQARTALRLGRLVPAERGWVPPPVVEESASPDPERPDEAGWVLPPERSWSPSELAAHETGPPGWADRVRCSFGRPAAVGLTAVAVAAAIVTGALVVRSRPVPVAAPVLQRAGQALGAAGAAPAAAEVVVSVVGKVRRPGLVRLAAGARVDDAVRAAGGPTAGLGMLNVARKVVDGEQIVVGLDPSAAPAGSASTGNGRLDLNTAGVGELDGLPGIGPVLAQRIVDWRTEHGRFASVDQLREVPGIGESKYVALKSKVAV